MRSILILGLLITLCVSANATTLHRVKKPVGIRFRAQLRVLVLPGERVPATKRFTVPGWTDEQTQYWLDNASAPAGLD